MQPTPDLSVISLFLNADIIVKCVILLLLCASIWSWTVILSKVSIMRKLNKLASEFEDKFWTGDSLNSLYDKCKNSATDPMSTIFITAMREWKSSRPFIGASSGSIDMRASLQQRIERIMQVQMHKEMTRVERYVDFLASVGSTATLIGLLGTVWGIMDSFTSIAATHSTNIAVVAPGIAEALFATALGLITAIPAVVFYNKISGEISRYENRLCNFIYDFLAIISKQLEGATIHQ